MPSSEVGGSRSFFVFPLLVKGRVRSDRFKNVAYRMNKGKTTRREEREERLNK